MRCFVAVVPPPAARDDLDAFLEPRRADAPLRWSEPTQLHVTLAFLERVECHRLDELVERLERTASRRRPFETRIAGGGAFPNVALARVLWTGLELDDDEKLELRRMSEGARAAANRSGVVVDGRRFTPHLTVARTSRGTELSSWVRLLDAYRGPAWQVDGFSLVASHLGEGPAGRPRHEELARFPFD